MQIDNLRGVRLVVSLSLHFTTRRTPSKLRLMAALCKKERHIVLEESHSSSEILDAALEAAVWCELRWNKNEVQDSLRSSELSPELLSKDRHGCVSSVIWKRRKALEEIRAPNNITKPAGKLLAYKPDSNLFDGIGQSESSGYLDFYDCPPWDSWVGYVATSDNSFLISWVPESIVSLVNYGADVICSDCIIWVNDLSESWAVDIKNA